MSEVSDWFKYEKKSKNNETYGCPECKTIEDYQHYLFEDFFFDHFDLWNYKSDKDGWLHNNRSEIGDFLMEVLTEGIKFDKWLKGKR